MRRSSLHALQTFASQYEAQLNDEHLLGKGRFSKVYRCKERTTGIKRAVKVVDLKELTDDEFQKVAMESSVCQMINQNPNIVSMINFYKEPSKHYLVYELVTGGELFDHIVSRAETGISEQECSRWMQQLFLALKECHDKNIVHRDVKLENLMLDEEVNPAIKLADFGLAVILENGPRQFGLAGSPAYVAPEVLYNQTYGKPVDMWSAGVAMYIMLSGTMPFNGDTEEEMFEDIKQRTHDFPESEWAKVSPSAKSLINDLLIRDPHGRIDVNGALKHPWIADPDKHAAKVRRREGSMRLKRRRSSMNLGKSKRQEIAPKWYAYDLDSNACAYSVQAAGEGSFMICKSQSRHIIVAFSSRGPVKYVVDRMSNGSYMFGMDSYKTLDEIVDNFRDTKPIGIGKDGKPIYLLRPALSWCVQGKREAQCKADVRACGPGSYLMLKTSETKFKLLLFDSGSVKTLKMAFSKSKLRYIFRKKEFTTIEKLVMDCVRFPVKGRGGMLLKPVTPALPSRMQATRQSAMV
eukprot:m.94831 g.94831  ORF g.94831 m.94831 type:complete len:521 (-) comp13462_c0_seq2:147-1709(-)